MVRTRLKSAVKALVVAAIAAIAVAGIYGYNGDRGTFLVGRTAETRDVVQYIGGEHVQDGRVHEIVGGEKQAVSVDVIVCRYWDPLAPDTVRSRAFWPRGTEPYTHWLPGGTTLPVFTGGCPVWWRR